MRKATTLVLGLPFAAIVACAPPQAVEPAAAPTLSTLPPPPVAASGDWVAVASLPAGATMQLISGDPAAEGPFRLRLRLPDNFLIPPHSHPSTENLTVVSGILHLGMGTTVDMAGATELRAGQSSVIAPNMVHFAHAAGETVLELHGAGPWQVNYVNPADDPRR